MVTHFLAEEAWSVDRLISAAAEKNTMLCILAMRVRKHCRASEVAEA